MTDPTPFNEVSILETVDVNEGMLYDNVVVGAIVPEPSSLGLVTLGAVGVLGRARRFRRDGACRRTMTTTGR